MTPPPLLMEVGSILWIVVPAPIAFPVKKQFKKEHKKFAQTREESQEKERSPHGEGWERRRRIYLQAGLWANLKYEEVKPVKVKTFLKPYPQSDTTSEWEALH